MREIQGNARTVRELLKNVKYSIDYYQREYKWQEKQIVELLDDLCNKFLEDYQEGHPRSKVADYGHYFLGSMIVSRKENLSYIVDGQQRLTSLTLLLIYLRHLQNDRPNKVNIDDLIFSEEYGMKSFNLDVGERNLCMKALFEKEPFDATDKPESVQNILARYENIEEFFPAELKEEALPYFIDWLLRNVHLVEITAYSDEDAYTIFETMNDRGLSLSPTDMLKGYWLASITDLPNRNTVSVLWKNRIAQLVELGKEGDSDFFKAWFRSQYATRIRERKRGAKQEDFDRIGTEYHRWFKDESETIGLHSSDEFTKFLNRDFDFYSRQYLRILEASKAPMPGLEAILFNAHHRFTLQPMLLLSPLRPDDSAHIIEKKLRIVAYYLDIFLTRRLWNFRSIAYSTMQYAMFIVMRDIRGLAPDALADKLWKELDNQQETFASNDRLRLHQQNRWALHRILARLTNYVEEKSGLPSRYMEYVNLKGNARYEVEHIWANKPERHPEFSHPTDFGDYRNRIGGLLLLPKSFNASFGDLTYAAKLPHYNAQNLLARSLNKQCYDHNPGFLQFVSSSGLPFHPYQTFDKGDLDNRSELYRHIAEQVWNPARLLQEGTA